MSDLQELLLSAFQVEHKEHLLGVRAVLDKAERGEALTAADLDEAFRRAHSLKGAARVCDLGVVETLGRRLETLFARLRKGAVRPEREVFKVARLVLDTIEDWSACLAEGHPLPETGPALQALDQLLEKEPGGQGNGAAELDAKLLAAFQVEHREHLEGIRAILAEAEDRTTTGADLDEAFRRAHSLKGAARLAELRPVEALAHRLEALFSRVRDGTLPLEQETTRAIRFVLDTIEDWAACLAEQRPLPEPGQALQALDRLLGSPPEGISVLAEAPPSPLDAAFSHAPETVRVSAENLDGLLRSAGQLVTESLRQNLLVRELARLGRQVEDMQKEWDAVRGASAAAVRQLDSTPGLARLGRYLGRLQNQVHSLARQSRAVRLLQKRCSWDLRALSEQLQQDTRRVCMVPAESIFHGFRKMVRDLARSEGKEVEFRVAGFDIRADRMVLQTLKDPLMHILRNAVSHGIEPPRERQDRGKDPVGQVALRLEAVGNRLHVLVQDDGRGIDLRRVAEVAVRRGLLSEAEATACPAQELTRFVFRPGFSTAGAVTDLAGRGMGLSVVYGAATRLQGEVSFGHQEGPGTALVLSVPLSVSSQRLVLVSCRGQTFAVPAHGIERLLRAKLQDVETVEGRPTLLLRGQPIPLWSLAQLLDMGEPEVAVQGDSLPLMVLRAGGWRVAVAVDSFLAERDAVVQDLDEAAAQVRKFTGAVVLEDGSVCLVLNLHELAKGSQRPDQAPCLKTGEPQPDKKPPTILVVDDSLTTRTLERSILEAHGYDVRLAVDGLEALDRLRAESADLVITDVQMPRMDGFALLEEMKKHPRLAQIPVIVVTSMDRREDQERGLALGADAYIVKRKFDHQDLLDTIQQIV